MPDTPTQDMDDTFRLLWMDGVTSMMELRTRMAELGERPNVGQMGKLWEKYCGFDGRTRPTHSIETGERFSMK